MATREYVILVKFDVNNVGGKGPLFEGGVELPVQSGFLQKIGALFSGMAAGNTPGKVMFAPTGITGGTLATGTITCTQATVSTGDTVTVGGQVFTVVAASPKKFSGEFLAGATDAECAANLAEVIGMNPRVTASVVVSVATNVVTIDSHFASSYADQYALAETGTGFVLSGATLGSGANQTQTDSYQGYQGS